MTGKACRAKTTKYNSHQNRFLGEQYNIYMLLLNEEPHYAFFFKFQVDYVFLFISFLLTASVRKAHLKNRERNQQEVNHFSALCHIYREG